MTIMKRLGTALLLVATVGLLAGGAALLWADARLDDAGAQEARVILSGPRVTDVELRREGAGTVRHLQPLTFDEALDIGSPVRVQVIDEPVTVTRLAGDDRFATWGVTVAAAGVVSLALLVVVVVRARRRRAGTGPGPRTGAGPKPAVRATAAVTLLLLSGCSLTGDEVDRADYRAARAAVAAALPAAAGADDAEAPAFGTPVAEPVAHPESAVAVVLAAAGLPSEPATVTAARFVTRQLFDPAMLCQGAPVDPVLELLVPEVAAQAAAHPSLVVRLGDCAGLDFGALRVGVAVGSVSPRLPNGRPGTTVSLTVSAVVPDADADGAPWAIQREVRVGTAAERPDRIVTVSWEGAQVGAGIGTPLLPEPGSLPAWDEELFPGPAEPDPDSAAAVVQALARTLTEKAVAVGQTTVSRASGEEPTRFTGSGVLVPATGEAQLTYQERGVTEVRVLGHQRQFSHHPADDGSEPWSLYATGETPGLFEGSYTNNPFAVLDWLRHLSAAAPAECPEGLEARACHAVEVPTAATLTPGTPGYREGMVHARRGNATMVMLVGVGDGRLAGVALSRRETDPDGTEHRVSSTWTFGPWNAEVPVVARPDSWRDVDA